MQIHILAKKLTFPIYKLIRMKNTKVFEEGSIIKEEIAAEPRKLEEGDSIVEGVVPAVFTLD
jgi:hypothetical protein